MKPVEVLESRHSLGLPEIEPYKFGWHDSDEAGLTARRGLSEEVVREISRLKNEPDWMLQMRLKALRLFYKKPMPTWGADLTHINFDEIKYFVRSTEEMANTWEDLPEDIRNTYDRLGIPEAEKQRLVSGVAAQYECLSGDTLVWTQEHGAIPVSSVSKGDTVISLNSSTGNLEEAKVLGCAQTGVKSVFTVMAGNKIVHASGNHPFLTLKPGDTASASGKDGAWAPLEELSIGDRVAVAEGIPRDAESDQLVVGFVPITSINLRGEEPVWDIQVAEHHNFVAGGLIVHNSEVVYHKIREDLAKEGVIFLDTDTALREHEELFKEYFGTIIPPGDNKFAALNTAVWSGGSFVYVPKGVKVDIPLQAYFRINTENMGQFERTLIIVDEDAYVHYTEGCSAPIYKGDSLHSAVVEIIVKKDARCRYTTIQNWSNNVYNLVTKRAMALEHASMEWIDCNAGSGVTAKYPSVWLTGDGARGETLSLAMAGPGQHQDTGAKMIHAAPNTSSNIVSKSVARGGGRTSYRGLVQVREGATNAKSSVRCDALLVDSISRSDTYPYVDVREDNVAMSHEATMTRISEDQLFYLMSRGVSETEAMAMIVRGFIEPIAKTLPMEYALELNRLVELQMEGAIG